MKNFLLVESDSSFIVWKIGSILLSERMMIILTNRFRLMSLKFFGKEEILVN